MPILVLASSSNMVYSSSSVHQKTLKGLYHGDQKGCISASTRIPMDAIFFAWVFKTQKTNRTSIKLIHYFHSSMFCSIWPALALSLSIKCFVLPSTMWNGLRNLNIVWLLSSLLWHEMNKCSNIPFQRKDCLEFIAQEFAMKANWILGCIRRGITCKDRDVIIPLSDGQATDRVLCSVLVPTIQKRCRDTREGLKGGHKEDQRAGEAALWGKTEGIRSILPGEGSGGTPSQYDST